MPVRDIYLKIESIADYSPVEPDPGASPPGGWRRDCLRNQGHEDGTIPAAETNARRLSALVYREYIDSGYLIPRPDKLVLADVNEPVFNRRVPGAVIYAHPGDRLRIHVFNDDVEPHSFHVHGLRYGIDSDGSWPFGTQSSDGRRSDEICPGQDWTYTFDVDATMVGAWPFHDHSRVIAPNVNRGLFGGIVVRPRTDKALPTHPVLPKLVDSFLKRPRRSTPRPLPVPAPPGPLPSLALATMSGHHGAGSAVHGGVLPEHGDHHGPVLRPVDPELDAVREFLHEWAHLPYAHPAPRPPDTLHVPIFLHLMSGDDGTAAFNSGPIAPGSPDFVVPFGTDGSFTYHCSIHPTMQGAVTVAMGGVSDAIVNIVDSPMMMFDPPTVTVMPGGTVRWRNIGLQPHTVTEDGPGLPTYCLNGRAFAGNTPTILATTGQKIRWYVFNLDFGMMWHNFHPHAQRWAFAGETIDVRSIGPAESFVLETTAPPVLLLPSDIQRTQDPRRRPKTARRYALRGDFLVHCHAEMHMMQGLVGIVRSQQDVWLTPAQADRLRDETGLPIDPGTNDCPDVDVDRCEEMTCGVWEDVPGAPKVSMMHAALLPNTDKVLYWGYTGADNTRLWDYGAATPGYAAPANQPTNVARVPGDLQLADLWSAEHTFLDNPEGTLLAHGGFTPREAYLFHPATLAWSRTSATAHDRFYSTTMTLADGRALTLFGSSSWSIEVYDLASGTWTPPKPLPASFVYQYYPWTYLLPDGRLFSAGPQARSHRFDWTAPTIIDDPAERWDTIAGVRSTGGEKGTSVLLPLRPPNYEPRVLIAGGDPPAAQQTSEMIDLSVPAPSWAVLPNLNVPRPLQVNSVLLPDGRVFLAGGVPGAGGPTEIFDPSDPSVGWILCASMTNQRGYHSAAILLSDGSVLMGGDQEGTWRSGETTHHERYYPSYFHQNRPTITNAPAQVAHGASFTVQTPDAASIYEIVLIRPGAVTHGFNMSQRFVGCEITGVGATSVQAQVPMNGNVVPPGHYLLFIVNSSRVPSKGRWIRVSP